METKTVKRVGEPSPTISKPFFKKILVAQDGSESSQRAAQAALELAEKLKADLVVLHAISPPTSYYHSTIASPTGMSLPAPSQHEIDAYYAYARKVALSVVGDTTSKAERHAIVVKTELSEAVSSLVVPIINLAAKVLVDFASLGSGG